jgi:glycine cleavage system H protein
MALPANARYTKDHEWAVADGDRVKVGITQYAADELGDIVFVDLPEAGDQVDAEEAFGSIESVKAVSDLLAPISGSIVEVNEELVDAPEKVNESPDDEGWMVIIEAEDIAEFDSLMDQAAYEAYLAEIA